MKIAILQGETAMVQEAVIELTQETKNQNNNTNSAAIQQAEEIEEELIDPISNLSDSLNNSIAQAQEENPDAEILIDEEIIMNLNTVLASPS